jgi:hypothetical protein
VLRIQVWLPLSHVQCAAGKPVPVIVPSLLKTCRACVLWFDGSTAGSVCTADDEIVVTAMPPPP